ncbi:Protein of unknown function DUF2081 [[Leptolyngbya] sp. PCC 7376]|uniref:GmrSD restriction endonuclease domain-containing protein n=1 Tax=[Leptolyngbya] sp. PCC 7376 TaxID=111781 RepID=UPI00029F401B|nr:DUF262 domain-containing protein [[Leptolyngbya] sp. PCC 7376]AFY40139.1 Protein of unknown function DUF2081 [[Leptolyngbya] sp. PCC 7376]
MSLPQPQTRTFTSLITDILEGQIQIPQFQRDFVWTMQKSAGLIDSIVKGYPIGTFIFWRTQERLRSIKKLGQQSLPEPDENQLIDYVLDGQQRLTSLFASLRGIKLYREGKKEDDFSKIFIDLEASKFEQIVVVNAEGKEKDQLISILTLLEGDFTSLGLYKSIYHPKIKEYQDRIRSYQFSIIQVQDVPIDIATEIFTRINVGGKPLSLFEIMVAKTYDHEKKFDLSEKFQELLDVLKPLNYETISDAIILQTVSMILAKECNRKTILKLDKNKFIEVWEKAKDAIERCIEYFRSYYRIPVSQLLPYNGLIVQFSYFFFHHPDKPTGDKQKFLEDFFWRCSLSGRYSSSLESKLAQDIKRIDQILNDQLPTYDYAVDTSPDFIINNGWFSAGRSYIKAILSIYAYFQPQSFVDSSLVNISNYWLKQANSKNYHHFFPKAYLLKRQEDSFRINHILNITIVDDFLNKRLIRTKAPSLYMNDFKNKNKDIESAMKSHLIDIDGFGIWDDDYDVFFEERAKKVSEELSKRIIRQDGDLQDQSDLKDDYEEEPTITE